MEQQPAQPAQPARDNSGRFGATFLMNCLTCLNAEPSRYPCEPNVSFRWDDNPHLVIQKPVGDHSIWAIDTDGREHDFELATTKRPRDFGHWRSKWLAGLMGHGPRPVMQRETAVALPPEASFRWAHNTRLLQDNFTYLMEDYSDPAWDIREIVLVDTAGTSHRLAFGSGPIFKQRVEIWRSDMISRHLGGFRMIFGLLHARLSDEHEVAVAAAIEQYSRKYDPNLTLDAHLLKIKSTLQLQGLDSKLYAAVESQNFPDFILSYATKSELICGQLESLSWFGREEITSLYMNNLELLVSDYVADCDHNLNLASHLYRLWRLYCDMDVGRMTLPQFRRHLLGIKPIEQALKPFMCPENMKYKWGDFEARETARNTALSDG